MRRGGKYCVRRKGHGDWQFLPMRPFSSTYSWNTIFSGMLSGAVPNVTNKSILHTHSMTVIRVSSRFTKFYSLPPAVPCYLVYLEFIWAHSFPLCLMLLLPWPEATQSTRALIREPLTGINLQRMQHCSKCIFALW